MAKSTVTGNTLVNSLPVGTLLEITAKGELTMVALDEPSVSDFSAGDRVYSKYGPATVVELSSRFAGVGFDGVFNSDSQVLYVSDDSNKVRIANPAELEIIW